MHRFGKVYKTSQMQNPSPKPYNYYKKPISPVGNSLYPPQQAKPFKIFSESISKTETTENKKNHSNMNDTNNNYELNESLENEFPEYSEMNKYVVEMLIEAIKDEKMDSAYYNTIAETLTDKEDKRIFHKIHNDEEKHRKIFTEIYKLITGNEPTKEQIAVEDKTISENMLENFSKAIYGELNAVEFYRKILFSFLNQELRDALYEIITDEQSHSTILSYMYSKYK